MYRFLSMKNKAPFLFFLFKLGQKSPSLYFFDNLDTSFLKVFGFMLLSFMEGTWRRLKR